MKKQLILEVYRGKTVEVSSGQENVPEGMLRVEGVFAVVNTVNRNNRYYPKDMYKKHIAEMQARIKEENGILGEMEHPKSMNIDLRNASHLIEDVWFDEDSNEVRGKLILLDTPYGKIAQSVVRAKKNLPISSRAVGTIGENKAVNLEYMPTFDIVGTAGFKQASLRIAESLDSSGNLIAECFTYDINESGDVVQTDAEKTDADLEKTIENLVSSAIDKKLKELNILSESDVQQISKDYVLENVVPSISKIIAESNDESSKNVEQSDDNKESTSAKIDENQIKAVLRKEFLEVYSPIIESWITEEYSPKVEAWVTNEFAPTVESWVTNEFAPVVESWVIKEFSPALESWITEEYSPKVESWVTNEFAPVLESWITEEFAPKHNVAINESKEDETDAIEKDIEDVENEVDAAVESDEDEKSTDKRTEVIKESSSKILARLDKIITAAGQANKKVVSESVERDIFESAPEVWLRKIPASYKHIWESLTDEQQAAIRRQASVRFFEHQSQIDSFWDTRDFSVIIEAAGKSPKKIVLNENVNNKQHPMMHQLSVLAKALR